MWTPLRSALGLVLSVVVTATPARAQLADALSNYDPANAIGYTEALRSGLLSSLGGGLFDRGVMRGDDSWVARISYQSIGVRFRDEDAVFRATAPLGFPRDIPDQQGSVQPRTPQPLEADAPSIVGASESLVVQSATSDSLRVFLPGGFDLGSLTLRTPQLTVGYGDYEMVLRYADTTSGDTELGDWSLFGLGGRADVTRFVDPDLPIRIAVLASYQSIDYADDLVQADLWSLGAQFGRRLGRAQVSTSLIYDSIDFGLDYVNAAGEAVEANESEAAVRASIAVGIDLPYVHLSGEVGFNRLVNFALGISLGI